MFGYESSQAPYNGLRLKSDGLGLKSDRLCCRLRKWHVFNGRRVLLQRVLVRRNAAQLRRFELLHMSRAQHFERVSNAVQL
jgi:hypothetical protein